MKSVILILIRLLLAGLFIYAGGVKLIQPDTFLSDIESYRLLPYHFSWIVALYLPPLEILSGLALLGPPMLRRVSASVLIVLMLVFLAAIISAWARGLNISCGCFGDSSGLPNYTWLVIRDWLMLAGLFFLYWHDGRKLARMEDNLSIA